MLRYFILALAGLTFATSAYAFWVGLPEPGSLLIFPAAGLLLLYYLAPKNQE